MCTEHKMLTDISQNCTPHLFEVKQYEAEPPGFSCCMAVEFSKPFEQGAVNEFVKSSEKLSKQFIY